MINREGNRLCNSLLAGMGLYGLTILVLYALSLRLDKPTYLPNYDMINREGNRLCNPLLAGMGLYGLTILVLYALSLRLDKPTYLFNSLIYPSLINIDLIFNNSSDNW